MDELCHQLHNSGIGCRIGSVTCNYIAYADDYCLLATSIEALQKLINMCEEYAFKHDITFNPTKTFCQCFIPREMDYIRPVVKICGKIIKWVDSVRYLGYMINCWERDTEELIKRKRELYAHANMVLSRFKSCSYEVKKYIFNTYFGNIYCISLWLPVNKNVLKSVQVAYNDAFRILFGYNRQCSASGMFCENGVTDFVGIQRRAAYSLLKRISRSDNPILHRIFNSRTLIDSSLYQTWTTLLMTNPAESECDLHNCVRTQN
jgi:hypothetical protein